MVTIQESSTDMSACIAKGHSSVGRWEFFQNNARSSDLYIFLHSLKLVPDRPCQKVITELLELLEAISPTLHNAHPLHRPFPAERKEKSVLSNISPLHHLVCKSSPSFCLILQLPHP